MHSQPDAISVNATSRRSGVVVGGLFRWLANAHAPRLFPHGRVLDATASLSALMATQLIEQNTRVATPLQAGTALSALSMDA